MIALAPMVDVTDTVFRQILAKTGQPDLFWTEFVNVDGLCSPGRPRLQPMLYKEATSTPIVAQIWGKNPDNYRQVAGELATAGFAAVDINMGCPDKTITKNGNCSALAKPENWPKAAAIIKATKEGLAGRLGISVKTRLGWDKTDFSWHQFLLDQGIDRLIIHGRTTKEMSRPPARWSEIGQIAKIRERGGYKTEIFGNGDIQSCPQGRALKDQYGLDGVMIGRAIFQNPYLFSQNPEQWSQKPPELKVALFRQHLELFSRTYPEGQRPFAPLKKFMKVYLVGFEKAPRLRQQFAQTTGIDEALDCLDNFVK